MRLLEPLRRSACGLLRCRVARLARTLAVTELSVALRSSHACAPCCAAANTSFSRLIEQLHAILPCGTSVAICIFARHMLSRPQTAADECDWHMQFEAHAIAARR